MTKGLFLTVVAIWLMAWAGPIGHEAAGPQRASPTESAASRSAAAVNQYCVTCHNERTKSGGLVLANVDFGKVARAPEVWEKVLRKLHLGAMPPPGARRPDKATSDNLMTWLETELDRAAEVEPRPGRPLLHRLNRAEYANAIRDLLALDVGDVASLLPPDDSAYGFDNIADVLGFSSLLTERYVVAAGRISALAVGDLDVAVGSETYTVPQDLSQDQHIEGQPFGTVGGIIVRHTFPVDGEYRLSATLMRTNVDQIRGLEFPYQLEFTGRVVRVERAPIRLQLSGVLNQRSLKEGHADISGARLHWEIRPTDG